MRLEKLTKTGASIQAIFSYRDEKFSLAIDECPNKELTIRKLSKIAMNHFAREFHEYPLAVLDQFLISSGVSRARFNVAEGVDMGIL